MTPDTQAQTAGAGEQLVDTLVSLAIAAGEVIMRVYADPDFTSHLKQDNSPVTVADTSAEFVILNGLREAFPGIPVVAEEEAAAGRVPETFDLFFLVDPLDGTKEFVRRNGEFTVNIALIDHGTPVAGVVYAPALGELHAGSAAGAFRASVREGALVDRQAIHTRPAPETLVAVGSRSHQCEETTAWLTRHPVDEFFTKGSSLKFCLVAAGLADIYPRCSRTMEWDTAAGDAVLRAAGGIVVDLDGRPLVYNKRGRTFDVDFANGHFFAFGDPAFGARSAPVADTGDSES